MVDRIGDVFDRLTFYLGTWVEIAIPASQITTIPLSDYNAQLYASIMRRACEQLTETHQERFFFWELKKLAKTMILEAKGVYRHNHQNELVQTLKPLIINEELFTDEKMHKYSMKRVNEGFKSHLEWFRIHHG